MTDNKAAAGPILGFVGGLVILVYGAYELYLAEILQSSANLAGFPVNGSLLGFVDGGAAGILLGILLIITSISLAAAPDYRISLGVLIIVLSLLSLVSLGGGNGVGLLLGVLGGTCALVFEPEGPTAEEVRLRSEFLPGPPTNDEIPGSKPAPLAPPPAPRTRMAGLTHRACPGCTKVIPWAFTTCPNCGAQV
jgi:hypothetical protein